MSKFLDERYSGLAAYVPGEQPQKERMIKLNTNENPYPPSPKVMKMREQIENLRLYPDPTASKLVNAIATYHGLKPEQVFVGVGSDDVLAMSFLTFFNSEKPILFPDITYSFYDVWAELYKIPYKQPKLDEDFCIRKEDYMVENGGIIFPNPNAPTGVCEDLEFIESILKENQDVIVIIDEAYIDFGGVSALELLPKYENLLVVRTFSKSRSMAGMRIGYAMGSEELIHALNVVKHSYNSYTMNQPSLVFGVEAVKDDVYFKETLGKIIKTREEAKVKLAELGFECLDSASNFLFAAHKRVPAKQIFTELKEEGIFVRYFNSARIDNYLRITVGTPEEMEKLYQSLAKYQ